MLFDLLLFFIAFGSNKVISAGARGEYPPHLSFQQYRGILSFASDDDTSFFNELETNENEEQTTSTTITTTIWDSLLSDALDDAEKEKAARATGSKYNNQNYEETLFPFIACHSDMSEMHGSERYNVLESILLRGHEGENDSKFFIKRSPIYNNNIESKTSSDKSDDKLFGTCFYSTIELISAKNIEEKEILLTPIAPLLKLRKNISGPSEDYNEESLDKDTISLSVMLAPGIFSSHDKAVEFASNLQQLKDMDQNDPFFTDCDKKPYQRSSINIGFSDTSYYFFYEFHQQDLKAGITHRCHRLFLEHIVTKPQVISVEKVSKNKISNHHARWTVESGTKDYRPWSDITGLNGKGETVFVADTGLDEQHCYLKDYDENTVESTTGWDLTNKIDRNLRKVIQYIELDDIASDRKDSNGHGTHIVASIVGKRLENGVEVDGLGDGVANGALISFYDGNDVLASDGDGDTLSISVNSILSQFFYFPRMAEAKITSASWNSGVFGEYDDRTRQVDEYFHNDPDDLMLMFNSAGNEGEISTNTYYGTTKYPCISKNVLCVGASLNYHSDMSEINVVAFFSSYGPTKDGRIKPDIVSPGEGILSANAGLNGCGPDSYPESVEYGVNHGGLVFKRGTSMACPIAAGAGALVRQYFADGYYPSGEKENDKMDITGSLLKAVLINGAVELEFRSEDDSGDSYIESTFYDRYQGFGKINLLNSLKLANELSSPDLYVENEMVIEKGQTHEYVFKNVCNVHEFRATLVWRDPPSDSGCVECLVNDLDSEVLYDGKTYYPNGRDGPDEKNNVERVILEVNKFTNPTGNTIRVKVKTVNLGYGISQKYSLASTGCFDYNEVELIGSDSGSKCEDDEFEYTIDIFTNRKPEETSWILKKQGSDEVIDAVTAEEYEEGVDWLKSFRYKGCITKGCYILIIKDTAFDGLCCKKGMGSYSIHAGDMPPIKGDSFVDRQKIEKFCNYGLLGGAEPTTSPTVLLCNDDEFKYQIDIETDLYPDETRWLLLRKPRIDGVIKGSYTESYREYVHEGCIDLGGCYSFFVSSYTDDYRNYFVEYTITANDFVVAERESFTGGKVGEFCYSYESDNSTPAYGIRTSVVGSNWGRKFDDVHSLWEYGKITKIELYTYDDVRFIDITYEDGQSFGHGSKRYGTRHTITLDEDQYITKVIGVAGDVIYLLSFETNDGEIFGPYGLYFDDYNYVYPFEFDFGRNALVYIFGRALDHLVGLTQLGFAYASLPQTTTDSPTFQPTSLPCSDDQFRYHIKIRTDDRPEETWWELHSIVDSVPFMTYRNQLESYSHTGCALIDEKYEFQMIDKKKDGLCCYFGSGSYKLSVDNNVVVRGNHFDDANHVGELSSFYYNSDFFVYNKHEFFYSSTLQPTPNQIEMICSDDEFEYWIRVRTDSRPGWTSWTFRHAGTEDIIESVGQYEYFLHHYEFNYRGCLPFNNCFEFYIYSLGGICCEYGNGGYTVFADDVVMAEGGEFWLDETKEFCYGPSYSQSPSLLPTSSSNPSSSNPSSNPSSSNFCDENEFEYEVVVTTFYYPSEASWELNYINGTSIDSVEKGYYTERYTEYVHKGCLESGSCVIFTILDYWGYGIDGYTLKANDDVMADTFCYVICNENEFEYYIIVTTDEYPEETSWELNYTNGTLIDSIEQGEYADDRYEHVHRGCLDNDSCVIFTIFDSWGDGLDYLGGYTLMANDDIVIEGVGGLWYNKTHIFCYEVCNENAFKYEVVVTTDYSPGETSWELNYTNGTLIDRIEQGKYVDGYYEHVYRGCLDLDSCIIFTIFDSYGNGISPGGYTLKANGVVMAEGGGGLWYDKTHTFCYGPSVTNYPSSSCENGSDKYYWCGWWASIGACDDDSGSGDWMWENCAKACSNCCMDYADSCEHYASNGRCTDTSEYNSYFNLGWDLTWQDWMQGNCRVSCDTCDLDFTPSPTPPPTPVICGDDQFKYEIVVTNDYYYHYWQIRYKYPEQIDGYDALEVYEDYSYGIIDSYIHNYPRNYEKRFYGCALYSCFDLRVQRAYLKMYDKDKDILIAQNTERIEDIGFCHYKPQPITPPLVEAIITITLEFSTSQSNYEDISKVVQRSVMKILFHTQIENENIVMDILDSSCENESKICDISFQICEGPCGEGEEPDFLAFVGNTMKEVEANGQLLQTINATADHMDVGILDSLTEVSILYNFEYDAWPTTSPTTSPSSTTPTQDCNTPAVVQNLFGFIANIFESISQVITNIADPISDILFGVESYNSSNNTCADKMFELHIEIKTDGSPEKTSWELLYENGTTIDSIVQDTYSECDTVYNHSYCLDTSCFVFNMFDSFEFKGSYNITVGDTVLAQQDSFFWWKNSKRFCYPQCDDDDMFALQLELMTDDWPQETSWDLTFDNGTIVDHVEERYYTGHNTAYNHRYCLYDDSRYYVTFHDHIGDGICCSYGSGSFKIKIDDEVAKEGGEFENVTSFSFPNNEEEVSCEGCNGKSLIEIITNVLSRQTNKM